LPKAKVLADKPSIAVLPFANISGDHDQEYLADGIVEDLITALSRFRWLQVIARNSSFIYKGRAVDVRQIARELSVGYVVEGSVRKSGNRLRITAQLIDAGSGAHVWADRYDRGMNDVFEIQDEITDKIATSLAPELTAAEISRAQHQDRPDLNAWDASIAVDARTHKDFECSCRRAVDKGYAGIAGFCAGIGATVSMPDAGRILWLERETRRPRGRSA